MAEQGEQGSNTPSWWRRFRWLYAARCMVACVVTLVAMAVIVRAVLLMLRPEKLQLKLASGRVAVRYITSLPPPGNVVLLQFVLRANNPSRRARFEYANVTVRLTDASSSSSSLAEAPVARIAEFDLPQTIALPQGMAHEVIIGVELTPDEDVPMRYVRTLYEGRDLAGVEMEVSGVLSTDGAMANASVLATYYCGQVTIAVDAADYAAADAPCLDKPDAPVRL